MPTSSGSESWLDKGLILVIGRHLCISGSRDGGVPAAWGTEDR